MLSLSRETSFFSFRDAPDGALLSYRSGAQNRLIPSTDNPTDASTFAGRRLRSIDALRGAAALAVVLYHAVGQAPRDETGALIRLLAVPVRVVSSYGYAGVFLFFVISGFCIHLHWARARVAATSAPKVAFVPFWKRRIFRLYPPYLIALALYLLWTAVNSGVEINRFFVWDMTLHLLMLHNFDSHTVYSVNSVFWTLAIEEQLYLAYFLLLYIRRRWGWKWTLIACAAARVGWLVLCVGLQRAGLVEIPVPESAASHWFTWALGALSVEAMVGLVVLPRWCRDLRVGAAALLSAVVLSLSSRSSRKIRSGIRTHGCCSTRSGDSASSSWSIASSTPSATRAIGSTRRASSVGARLSGCSPIRSI